MHEWSGEVCLCTCGRESGVEVFVCVSVSVRVCMRMGSKVKSMLMLGSKCCVHEEACVSCNRLHYMYLHMYIPKGTHSFI